MSHPVNDQWKDILLDQMEAISKMNPDQLKVFNEVQKILFENYWKGKVEKK